MLDPISVTELVVEALKKVGASYVIGGSLASAVHGIPRATLDADLVSDVGRDQVEAFVKNLGDGFYADSVSIQDSLRQGQSFNIIHLDTMFKVDIFPLSGDAYAQEEFRRRKETVVLEGARQKLFIVTPEDSVLTKLVWYRKGGEVSDRQWQDISGILKVQGEQLDFSYLERWAKVLDVFDLLKRVRSEVK